MLVKKEIDIILASKSPRRKELLSQIEVGYRCVPSGKEEIIHAKEPAEVVMELSQQKACDVEEEELKRQNMTAQTEESGKSVKIRPMLVIGADTVVSCDGVILGKPRDEEDAFAMLSKLSGSEHEVYTGVTVIYRSGYEKYSRRIFCFSECTKVQTAPLSEREIRDYIATGEPMDKAGAYGIQGKFARFVTKIDGDYNNVVGLPVARLWAEVKNRLGIDLSKCTMLQNKPVRACIFDLDGTTLDTLESIGSTVNMTLKELGLQEHALEDYRHFAGDGQYELIRRSLAASGDTELVHYDEAISRYVELFQERCTYHVRLYDGIQNLLDCLKAQGVKVCILSNKQHENVMTILNGLMGENYFDAVRGLKDQKHKKPDGQGIDRILETIGVSPENCLYIGDTDTDMLTGKRYGLYTIGVTWGFRSPEELAEADADMLVDSPEEILQFVQEVKKE